MSFEEVVRLLKKNANPKNVEGMARFGISSKNTLGISIYTLRDIAKNIKPDHALALRLWKSGIHEARLLASMVDEADKVTEAQMDSWAKDFDSWDVCDQVCSNLFDKTPFAYKKAIEWPKAEREFVRRAGFALMAALAWQDKNATDKDFIPFFPVIKKYSTDERNYVKKAVNWALRNIGKRRPGLKKEAIKLARQIHEIDSKAARWIAADALRELRYK